MVWWQEQLVVWWQEQRTNVRVVWWQEQLIVVWMAGCPELTPKEQTISNINK